MRVALALLLACSSFAAAEARVPAARAATDGLGVSIQGRDVYTLPARKKIYHGTINEFPAFRPMEASTWFGADAETSAAMGYWRWCMEKGRTRRYPARQPLLLTVDTQRALNLLLVPVGWEGHFHAAAIIGMPWTKANRSFYGSGSTGQGVQPMLNTICATEVWLNPQGRITHYRRGGRTCARGVPPSAACNARPAGRPVKLNGWRAPWDQNEIAICSADTTPRTFKILPALTIKLPVRWANEAAGAIDGDNTCAARAPFKTRSVQNQDRATGHFDVVFVNPGAVQRFFSGLNDNDAAARRAKYGSGKAARP